jgi:hypothetical protein
MGKITNYGEDISNDEYTLTRTQFRDMISRRKAWTDKNGTEPNFVRLPTPDQNAYILCGMKQDGTKDPTGGRMEEMEKRFNKYTREHENTEPNLICILPGGCGFGQTGITLKEKYNSLIGAGYSHYQDDQLTPEQEKQHIAQRIGMNCVDWSQYMKKWCDENGYNSEYLHRYCQSGEGHILLRVWGKEYGNTKIVVDMAAGASVGSKYPLGQSWCENYKSQFVSTEPWLVNDDGKT